MSGSEKVWVIDIEEATDRSLRNETSPGTRGADRKDARRNPHQTDTRHSGGDVQPNGKYPGLQLGLAYVLGPLALLLTARGRRNKLWLAVALGSSLAGIVALANWQGVLALISGRLSIPIWAGTVAFITLTGFTVWSRAIYLVGTDHERVAHLSPRWLKNPWLIGGLGLLAPGLGLLVAGCRKRASLALWLYGPVALAALVLAHATWLWSWLPDAGETSSAARNIEYVFLAAAALTVLGAVGWLVQALEGARQVSQRHSLRAGRRGHWYWLALVGVIVALVAVSEPASWARSLARYGGSLRRDGYRYIPLTISLVANRLDPARPAYLIQAIELHHELGNNADALRLRNELDNRMQPYLSMLEQEGPYDLTATFDPTHVFEHSDSPSQGGGDKRDPNVQ